MQIKQTAREGYVQLVRNKYDSERRRTVGVGIGSLSIFKAVPPVLWEALDGEERAQLSVYIGQELGKINLVKITETLAAWPRQFDALAAVWPAVADEIGADEAIRQFSDAEKAFKRLKKAAKTVSKPEEIDDEN